VAGGGGGPKWKDRVEVKGRKVIGQGIERGRRQSSCSEFLGKKKNNSSQPSPFIQTICQLSRSHKNSTKSYGCRKSRRTPT